MHDPWQTVAETAADLALTVAPFGAPRRSMLEAAEAAVEQHCGSDTARLFAKFARAVEAAQASEDPCATCGGTGERDYGRGAAAYADVCDACDGLGYDL